MRRALRSIPLHYAQGLLMGGADVIPGVSGGTMALIVGIYQRLIDSISNLASSVPRMLRGDLGGSGAAFRAVEWRLVLPLGAGIVTALVIGAAVIPGLLEAYPVQTAAVFFGLIAGSVAIPWRRIDHPGWREAAIAVVAALVAFLLVGLPPRQVADPALAQVFGTAAIAICAMILPGVSGAFLLLVLGVYEATLAAVDGRDLAYIATFVAGAAVGLGVFSTLLDWLLDRYYAATYAALVGLMAGSLRALWPWQSDDRGLQAPPSLRSALVAGLLALAAFAAVAVLERYGKPSPVSPGSDRR